MHRGQVRAVDPTLQPEPARLERQRLDMPRHRIVGFVAVHIDAQAPMRRISHSSRTDSAHRRHGLLEMRNAADHVHAQVERFAL